VSGPSARFPIERADPDRRGRTRRPTRCWPLCRRRPTPTRPSRGRRDRSGAGLRHRGRGCRSPTSRSRSRRCLSPGWSSSRYSRKRLPPFAPRTRRRPVGQAVRSPPVRAIPTITSCRHGPAPHARPVCRGLAHRRDGGVGDCHSRPLGPPRPAPRHRRERARGHHRSADDSDHATSRRRLDRLRRRRDRKPSPSTPVVLRSVDLSFARWSTSPPRRRVPDLRPSNLVLVGLFIRVSLADCRTSGLTLEGGRCWRTRARQRLPGRRRCRSSSGGTRLTIERAQWARTDFRATASPTFANHPPELPGSQWVRGPLGVGNASPARTLTVSKVRVAWQVSPSTRKRCGRRPRAGRRARRGRLGRPRR